jgi:glycosyltransferase involved in cell wall biosynthesis
MLIAIEAERANIDNATGVEHYAKQLILALAKIDLQNQYILYLRTNPKAWILNLPKNFRYKVMPFPFAWTQVRLSWEIFWQRPDALFIPASSLPLIHPANSIVTVHDLAWHKFPETFDFWRLTTLRFFNWYVSKFAKKIIAISQQTKKDLLEKYDISPQKIFVIHHGFGDEENEIVDEEEQKQVNALPQQFILYLGTLQPRKNPQGLIDAFLELKEQNKIEHALVLAGGKGWLYNEIMKKIAKHPQIIYLGYVKDRFALLRKASLLIQPAFYEGFGLQLLDAFAAAVPVVAANAPAMPEVAGEAAIYFDPYNKESMKNAILKVLENQALSKELVKKGTERLKQFSWDVCARETLKVIISAT